MKNIRWQWQNVWKGRGREGRSGAPVAGIGVLSVFEGVK